MRKLVLIFLLGFTSFGYAQEVADTTFVLPERVVKANRSYAVTQENIPDALDIKAANFASDQGEKNIAHLLAERSGFAFQNYGVSGSALVHFRGSTPSQFGVHWNGINIGSSFLGQSDLSLLPAGLFNEVDIYGAGETVIAGNTGMSGSLNLSNAYRGLAINEGQRKIEVKLGTNFSSLNNLNSTAEIILKSKRFQSLTKINSKVLENDFSFENTALAGNPETKMQNADLNGLDLLQSFKVNIDYENWKSVVLAEYWFSETERGIPIQDFQTERDDRQDDLSHRAVAKIYLERLGGKLKYNSEFAAAYLHDEISYNGDESKSDKVVTYSDHTLTLPLGTQDENLRNLIFTGRLQADFVETSTENFSQNQNRGVYSWQTGIAWKETKYGYPTRSLALNVRQEFIDEDGLPLSGTLSLTDKIRSFGRLGNTGFQLGLALSRTYRFPTLNDWYWSPGGNPELKPEDSWNLEVKQTLSSPINNDWQWQMTAQEYYSKSDDWIQWLPGEGGIWSPENIEEVERIGIELMVNVLKDDKSGDNFYLGLDLNRSETTDGTPLLFQPGLRLFGGLSYNVKDISFRPRFQFMSQRWDGNNYLDNLFFVDLSAERDFSFSKRATGLSLRASVNNILNSTFHYRPHQPMPGRHFSIGVNYKFIKSTYKTRKQ